MVSILLLMDTNSIFLNNIGYTGNRFNPPFNGHKHVLFRTCGRITSFSILLLMDTNDATRRWFRHFGLFSILLLMDTNPLLTLPKLHQALLVVSILLLMDTNFIVSDRTHILVSVFCFNPPFNGHKPHLLLPISPGNRIGTFFSILLLMDTNSKYSYYVTKG